MFQIKVPTPDHNDGIVIAALKVTIVLEHPPTVGQGVAFRVTDWRDGAPGLEGRFPNQSDIYYTNALVDPFDPCAEDFTFSPVPEGALGLPEPSSPDLARMTPPADHCIDPEAGDEDDSKLDPRNRRFRLVIELLSDSIFDFDAFEYKTTMPEDEIWTIDLDLETTGSNSIVSACVESFTYHGADPIPNIKPSVGACFVDALGDCVDHTTLCAETRPGVDAILVLDKSGSMDWTTEGNPPEGIQKRKKIVALRAAVLTFVQAWDEIRMTEGVDAPDDNLGVVLFDSSADWWDTVSPEGLVDFEHAKGVITQPNLDTILPSGSTAIGKALLKADRVHGDDPERRRVVLLMTNGEQNVEPFVGVKGKRVFTHDSGSTLGPDIPNQDNYRVYTVTVGAIVNGKDIHQQVATARGGFFIDSELEEETLRRNFIELLQNFVRFNTWETARLASGTVESFRFLTTEFLVSSTTARVSITALWPAPDPFFAHLRMLVFVPGLTVPVVEEADVGTIKHTVDLTDSDAFSNYDPMGIWRVVVELVSAEVEPVPVHVVVLVDDRAVNADLGIAYTPGDQIRLRATLTEFGQPVMGLGTRPGETAVVRVRNPSKTLGDLLSDSREDTEPAPPPPEGEADPQTDASKKLFNELQKNPGTLTHGEDVVLLRDDGHSGVYTGLYTPVNPGSYTFTFDVQGRTSRAGFFSRQQVESVHVRAVPDGEQTKSQSFYQDPLLTVIPVTPARTKLGPGFANYLWSRPEADPAMTPVRAQDLLNGSYTFEVPSFEVESSPEEVHFLPVSIHIDDATDGDQIAELLDDTTKLITLLFDESTGEFVIVPA